MLKPLYQALNLFEVGGNKTVTILTHKLSFYKTEQMIHANLGVLVLGFLKHKDEWLLFVSTQSGLGFNEACTLTEDELVKLLKATKS